MLVFPFKPAKPNIGSKPFLTRQNKTHFQRKVLLTLKFSQKKEISRLRQFSMTNRTIFTDIQETLSEEDESR